MSVIWHPSDFFLSPNEYHDVFYKKKDKLWKKCEKLSRQKNTCVRLGMNGNPVRNLAAGCKNGRQQRANFKGEDTKSRGGWWRRGGRGCSVIPAFGGVKGGALFPGRSSTQEEGASNRKYDPVTTNSYDPKLCTTI